MNSLSVCILAGEPSGDRLGAGLMRGIRTLHPKGPVTFTGLGGPAMAGEGLTSWFPISDLSVMGLSEILPRLPRLLSRIRLTADMIAETSPDVVVTIDSPDFMHRVVGRARRRCPGVRFTNYVAPSVWNWRSGRARRIRRLFDLQLALLPFEPPYFERVGLPCEFVGHPVVEEEMCAGTDLPALRAAWDLDPAAPVVVVLPGSRSGEISRLSTVFGKALGRVAERISGVAFILPSAPGMEAALRAAAHGWPVPVRILADPEYAVRERQKRAAFAMADVALAASGTVTLELAAAGLPAVVAYRLSPVTWAIAKRLVRHDSVSLVNILLGERAVPEYLQDRCRPELLADAMIGLLHDTEARDRQVRSGRRALDMLGRGGEAPSLRAARAVLDQVR